MFLHRLTRKDYNAIDVKHNLRDLTFSLFLCKGL